jgi:ribosome-associated heat shock protein Hsp15
MPASQDPVRVDRWLWAARLVKTRPLAAEAVQGGRVEVNGQRVKPSRLVKPGDRLDLTLGQGARIAVDITATAERRASAKEAQLLYDETPESAAARERHAAERRLAQPPQTHEGGRPTKRDRRRLEAERGRGRR